jgi:hypothetical protein
MEKYRIVDGIAAYFVTFTVVEWLPVFIGEDTCKIITESLNFCITNKSLRVNAYVIMSNHMHAVLFDSDFDTERLQHTLDDFRKFTGRQLSDYCDKHFAPVFGEGSRTSFLATDKTPRRNFLREVLCAESKLHPPESGSQGTRTFPGRLAFFIGGILAERHCRLGCKVIGNIMVMETFGRAWRRSETLRHQR